MILAFKFIILWSWILSYYIKAIDIYISNNVNLIQNGSESNPFSNLV